MPYEHAYYCAPRNKADLSNRSAAVALRDFEPLMTAVGQTRSFGRVGSMSGLSEGGHGWTIYEYT